ncbi:YhbY family RNA-binding protein [Candidatus Pacearchaeota archaeon]|nr:YhbY family RNA-binding protein [Candidatus Pacearchaeota archaeon]
MPNPTLSKFQIGKNGLTEGVLQSLSQDLKYHKQVRVSVLKSACRNREELSKMAVKLKESLPVKNYRILGYTIILIK